MNDQLRERLVWFITNPITAFTAVLGLVSHAFSLPVLDALWLTIWNNAGLAFTLLSVIRSQISGPLFGVIPPQIVSAAAGAVGMVFVLSIASRLYGRFKQRLKDTTEE